MANLRSDLVYALRQFRQAPVFTLTAVATLAIGIGGTTAVFSLMNDVMLRSLPVVEPDRLHRVGSSNNCCVQGGPQDNWGMYPMPFIRKIQAATPQFEEITAFQAGSARMSVLIPDRDKAPKPLRSEYVTGNYFRVFGIRPFAGRLLTPDDDKASAAPVIAISYRAWQEHWGGQEKAIGSTVVIAGKSFTVAGIAPPGFFGETLRANPPDIWIPLEQEPLLMGNDSLLRQGISAWLRVIGRLKPGATVAGMPDRLTAELRHWMEHEYEIPAVWRGEVLKSIPRQKIEVIPAGNGVTEMRENYSRSLNTLLAVCGLVLLIACANVANLMLARGMARRAQTSIRMALGASRSRLVHQALAESVLLALVGGGAGLAVASAAQRLLGALAFPNAAHLPFSTTPSWPVLAFAVGASLVTGLIFGVAPAWFAARRDPVEALRGAGRTIGGDSSLTRRVLLVAQAAMSVVLIAGSVMLTRSLTNIQHQDFGFRTAGLTHVAINQPPASYSPEKLDALYRSLQSRLSAVPGVERAGLALYAPFTDNWSELIFVDGRPVVKLDPSMGASWDRVSAGYFETIGQPIVRGRAINETDTGTGQNVAVVNEAFAKRFFPNEDPLDKFFGIDIPTASRTYRIVGVVRDAKYRDPGGDVSPMFFPALAQTAIHKEELLAKLESRTHFIESVLLRTNIPAGTLEPRLRTLFAEVDPSLTIIRVEPFDNLIAGMFDQQRAVATLAGLFGLIALVLAAIGLYGVIAYTVARRTGEFGVRMALGAGSGSVMGLVLQDAMKLVTAGLVLGLPLAVGAGRLIRSELYGVKEYDVIALAAGAVALVVSALVAALVPARRASRIDPMTALRTE